MSHTRQMPGPHSVTGSRPPVDGYDIGGSSLKLRQTLKSKSFLGRDLSSASLIQPHIDYKVFGQKYEAGPHPPMITGI